MDRHTDPTVLVVEHERTCPPGLFGQAIEAAGVRIEVARPYLGRRLPTTPDGYAGVVVLGGEMAAWADEVAPWLPATRELIAASIARRVPTLGICLGSQLMALACGGRVERGAAGAEIGLVEVQAVDAATADPFFGALVGKLGTRWPVRQFHLDTVTRLPPDAELMLTGRTYPHQGFRVGESGWAVQYHPEVADEGFADWVAKGAAAGVLADADRVMSPLLAAGRAQEQVAAAHAVAFAARVRSAAGES